MGIRLRDRLSCGLERAKHLVGRGWLGQACSELEELSFSDAFITRNEPAELGNVLKVFPDNGFFQFVDVVYDYSAGRYKTSRRKLEKLCERYPDDRFLRDDLVICTAASGDVDDAVEMLERVDKRDFPVVCSDIAHIAAVLGHKDKYFSLDLIARAVEQSQFNYYAFAREAEIRLLYDDLKEADIALSRAAVMYKQMLDLCNSAARVIGSREALYIKSYFLSEHNVLDHVDPGEIITKNLVLAERVLKVKHNLRDDMGLCLYSMSNTALDAGVSEFVDTDHDLVQRLIFLGGCKVNYFQIVKEIITHVVDLDVRVMDLRAQEYELGVQASAQQREAIREMYWDKFFPKYGGSSDISNLFLVELEKLPDSLYCVCDFAPIDALKTRESDYSSFFLVKGLVKSDISDEEKAMLDLEVRVSERLEEILGIGNVSQALGTIEGKVDNPIVLQILREKGIISNEVDQDFYFVCIKRISGVPLAEFVNRCRSDKTKRSRLAKAMAMTAKTHASIRYDEEIVLKDEPDYDAELRRKTQSYGKAGNRIYENRDALLRIISYLPRAMRRDPHGTNFIVTKFGNKYFYSVLDTEPGVWQPLHFDTAKSLEQDYDIGHKTRLRLLNNYLHEYNGECSRNDDPRKRQIHSAFENKLGHYVATIFKAVSFYDYVMRHKQKKEELKRFMQNAVYLCDRLMAEYRGMRYHGVEFNVEVIAQFSEIGKGLRQLARDVDVNYEMNHD